MNTRELILDSAFEEFCSGGIEGTEMRRLALKMKIGHATLYRYYANRHELARSVYLRNLDFLTDMFFDFPLDGSALDIVSRCFERVLACYIESPDKLVFDLMYNLYSVRAHEDPTADINHFFNSPRFKNFRGSLSERLEDGSLKPGILWDDIFAVLSSISGYLQRVSTFELQDPTAERLGNIAQARRLIRFNIDMLAAVHAKSD